MSFENGKNNKAENNENVDSTIDDSDKASVRIDNTNTNNEDSKVESCSSLPITKLNEEISSENEKVKEIENKIGKNDENIKNIDNSENLSGTTETINMTNENRTHSYCNNLQCIEYQRKDGIVKIDDHVVEFQSKLVDSIISEVELIEENRVYMVENSESLQAEQTNVEDFQQANRENVTIHTVHPVETNISVLQDSDLHVSGLPNTDDRNYESHEERHIDSVDTESEFELPLYLEEFKNEIIQKVMQIERNTLRVNIDQPIDEKLCRICYDTGDDVKNPLVTVCKCKGSVGLVHLSCLEKWLNEKTTNKCELCQYKFKTQFIPTEPNIIHSMFKYMCLNDSSRGFVAPSFQFDFIQMIAFTIILTLFNVFLLQTGIKVASAHKINANFATNFSTACTGILITSVFSILFARNIFLHYWIWYRWWMSTFTVKLLAEDTHGQHTINLQKPSTSIHGMSNIE